MENQDQNKSFPTWALILAIFIEICITAFVYKLKLEPEDSVNIQKQSNVKKLKEDVMECMTYVKGFKGPYNNYYNMWRGRALAHALANVKKEPFEYKITECERRHKPKRDYCEKCKYYIEYQDRRLKEIENRYDNEVKEETENIINRWKKNGKMFDPQGKETCPVEHIIGNEKLKEIKKIAEEVCSNYDQSKVPKNARLEIGFIRFDSDYHFYWDDKTSTLYTVCLGGRKHEIHVENKLKELILPLVTKDLIIKNMHIDKDIREKIQESNNLYIMIKFDSPNIRPKTLEKTLELEIYY